MKTRSWIVAIFMVTITAFSAHAATGTVAGRLTFFQSNGGYCPDDGLRDCSGSLYPQSQRSSWSPVANGRVYLYQLSTGLLIGAGTTNSNGNFAINWFGPTTAQAVVAFKAEHKDGRFKVIAPSGALYRFNSPIFNLTPGTTPGRHGRTRSRAPTPSWRDGPMWSYGESTRVKEPMIRTSARRPAAAALKTT